MTLSAFIAFAVATAQVAPAASSGLAGHYVADVGEAPASAGLSSSLDLRPDGEFEWHFTVEGRNLAARGQWEDECGTRLNLINEMQVGAPEVQLVRATREVRDGLLVALDPDSLAAEPFLEVEAEYPGNFFGRFPFDSGLASIPIEGGRPILAVRLFSEPFAFRSEAFPVAPDGANALTFRLIPGDFGQATFGTQSMPVRGDVVTIDWRGFALRYTRVPEEGEDRISRRADACHDLGPSNDFASFPAAASDAPTGFYVARMRETATAIELGADGRFAWFFSQGALDMRGQGRWSRTAEGEVLLDSDPPVTAPAFELVDAGRDGQGGLVVGLVPDSEEAALFLGAEAEYAGGERVVGWFEGLEARFPSDAAHPVIAVRLGSGPFGFLSDPFPVAAEANRLTFRFIPNDLGLADFRQQRVAFEPGVLTLSWNGLDLRYERVDPDPALEDATAEP